MPSKTNSNRDIENKIIELLSSNLMSVTQISQEIGVRKDVGSAILKSMKKRGKLELHKVGRSKIYTIPGIMSDSPAGIEKEKKDKKLRTIGIVSGKGGTGKTTVTLNLAGALMNFDEDVMAVDADIKMAGLGLRLGMYNFSNTLNDVIRNNGNILEALHIHSSGIRIIPASLTVENLELTNLYPLMEKFLTDKSLILIDSPPGLEDNFIQVLHTLKEIIVVTTPETQSITNAIKAIDKAKELDVNSLGVVINRYSGRGNHRKVVEEIESICDQSLLGVIPEDKTIQDSLFKKSPNVFLNPYSPSSLAFKEIAAKISGKSYEAPKFPFLKRIWGKIS